MEVWLAKMICLLIMLVVPMSCNLLPFKVSGMFVKKGEKGKRILSCLMCFGGGVFLATYMLHMGPEVRYILKHALVDPYHITYPIADFIMACGFFMVFILEKIILKLYKKRQSSKIRKRKENCTQRGRNSESENPTRSDLVPSDIDNITVVINPPKGLAITPTYSTLPLQDCEGFKTIVTCCEDCHKQGKTEPCSGKEEHKRLISNISPSDCPLLGTGECCNDPIEVKRDASRIVIEEYETEDNDIIHAHDTRSIMLVVALSLHRIFEGMTIGLQHSLGNVWRLLLAVMCHETVIGFGLGLQFVKNQFGLKRMLIASLLCSLIMPLGIIIGTVLVEVDGEGKSLEMVNGILQAIATGTFIYVTFFEILHEEIDPHDTDLTKVFSVMGGFALMALMSLIPEENPTQILSTILVHNATYTTTVGMLTTSNP